MMKKYTWYALGAVITFSILIRTVPLFGNTLWGFDCGEYVYYTDQWVTGGKAYLSVDGWGQAYPYFPGMLIVGSSFHLLTGLPVTQSTVFVPVVISALSPLFIFLFIYKITRKSNAALLGSVFFTVLPPVIYNYSQPKPETVGVFLLLFILTVLVSMRDNNKMMGLLVISSISLIITHHLTSYFLILFLIGGYFVITMWRNKEISLRGKRIYFYILFVILTISFWLSVPPFRHNRIYEALVFPSYSVLILPFLLLPLLKFSSKMRSRIDYVMPINLHRQEIKSFLKVSVLFIVLTVILLTLISFGIFTEEVEIGYSVFLYTPTLLLGTFSLFSRKIIKAYREGPFVVGWLLFTFLSITAGLISGSTSLRPIRHVSFFVIPLTLFFGLGIYQFYQIYNPSFERKKAVTIGGIILILIALNIPLAYPSQDIAAGYDEGTGWDDLESFYWIRELEGKIATDHRMSAAAFSLGIKNVTWTEGKAIFFSSSLNDSVDAMDKLDVRYIVLDEEMKKGVGIEPGKTPRPFNKRLLDEYRKNSYILYSSEECKVYSAPVH